MVMDSASPTLSDNFLSQLVIDLDDDTVRAIILHGSYARGDAVPPYSDIDLVRITKETPDRTQQKRFIWYNSYLLNLSSRPLSIYQEWLSAPEEAIFRIQSIREARILLDKDGAFRTFQQEAMKWTWEPLQTAANAYASQLLNEESEIILKILRALQKPDIITLTEMVMLDLLSTVTDAIAVQRGILVKSGNSYLHQVQDSVGLDSAWTRYYMDAVGATKIPLTIEQRSIAALYLYQETVQLLRSTLLPEHEKAMQPLLKMINDALHERD
jgi:predicted nucleotidyltransferase